ncbi:hypothetical protein [Clostridioides difficile]|uniref:hypothetical protein n=1 Tax=Clostridioides difficile TaxID=1496 RepID=UPI001C18234B|nr:hypothetical protein [Clostridioides difficile]HBE9109947.1 hypothetical protein [Clostridioides difficile]HBF5457048.1 hypothetical protein [Clostridioides difficile]
MASGWYECLRTVKKRRGYHSEADIHSYSCYLDDSEYYGSYNLRTIKDIYISETKTYYVNSYEVYFISKGNGQKYVMDGYVMRQSTKVQFVPDPTISINNDLGVIGDACSIKYRISDSDPTVRFKIVHKLNGVVIEEKDNTTDSNYTINLTDEHLSELSFNSTNNITIELNNTNGSRILDKTVTFTKGNTKPKLNISSYNSTSATFTAIDTDNNLSKIEWFIDDVLKETITTDLYLEKTINYELTDNAIHTLKIVATDAENATAEKVLSISKEIMPLQSDATLQDISTKLIEIGEGFKNGKTSIINTLALKNIEASLNNTLVELSEKIKTSFDSSDASVQDLMNQLTQANNTISQLNSKYKYASGTASARENSSLIACIYDPNTSHTVTEASPYWIDLNGIGFIPDIFFAECEYEPHSNAFYKYFVFAIKNTFSISNNTGFVVNIAFNKEYSDKSFGLRGVLYTLGKRNVSMDNTGVRVPALNTLNNLRAYKWHAIKFK